MVGEYELRTTEATGRARLWIQADGTVVRAVAYADRTQHTRWGAGRISGGKLEVAFANDGDPRDLSGAWEVRRERASGTTAGTATFERAGDGWVAHATLDSEEGSSSEVELRGKLAHLTLAATRSDDEGTSSATYALAPTGLVLVAKLADGVERFVRGRLPAGDGTTGTYEVVDGRITGSLATGARDEGTRVTAERRTALDPDPVPNWLLSLKATAAFAAPKPDSKKLLAIPAHQKVPVFGTENDYWVVRLAARKAYVPKRDLQTIDRRYAPVVAGALFGGKPSAKGAKQLDLGVCYLVAALMGIADVRPDAIRDMVRDDGDGTVSVRFYFHDESGFEERWVHVARTVIVDDQGRPHYATAESGQMWLPLFVKAYAVFHGGGFYGNIEGGRPSDVFSAVFGRVAADEQVATPFPVEQPRILGRLLKLDDADVKVLEAHRRTRAWTEECAAFLDVPGSRADPATLERHLDRLVKAGLSLVARERIAKLHAAYFKVGPLGSGEYSTRARELWKTIRATLDAKLPAVLGTQRWGRGGTGQSAGENVALVPGLASTHAYVVRDAFARDGLLWVRVENPWGRFGRRYERKQDRWTARATTPAEDAKDAGTFDVELSDVVRYFAQLHQAR